MRRDAWSHPHPEKFDEWVNSHNCPYQTDPIIERMHFFNEKKSIWKPGAPTMKDSDLIITICEEKGWNIKY
jgi:hypothetical protein